MKKVKLLLLWEPQTRVLTRKGMQKRKNFPVRLSQTNSFRKNVQKNNNFTFSKSRKVKVLLLFVQKNTGSNRSYSQRRYALVWMLSRRYCVVHASVCASACVL